MIRFVILHGTDTLAYTSSALSFMLENLGKTVILTGSQIPCFETRSGELIIITIVYLSATYCIKVIHIDKLSHK